MKYVVIASIVSMNLFIVLSGLMKQFFRIPIEVLYYPSQVLIAVVTGLFVLVQMFKTKKVPLGLLLLLATLVLIYSSYFFSPHADEKLAKNTIIFFSLWCVSASICGIYIKEIEKAKVIKFFKFIFFLFSFTFLVVILIPYILGMLPPKVDFGLMNYQNASYLSAFTVGIGIYLLVERTVKHRWLYFLMLILTIPSVFIPGGRGGAVLLILYAMIYLLMLTFRKGVNAFVKLLIYVIGIACFALLVNFIIASAGESRTFSYISSGGIDINNGTSGRGPIYQLSTYFIGQQPLFGYGPFNYYHLIHNIPHNIVLEILLSFGVVGLLVILTIIGMLIWRFVRHFDFQSIDLLVVFIAIYPLTLLMFSSNYLVVSEFWFVLFYLLTKGRRQNGQKDVYH
ncbi:O-antigen ligase family protein [Staphylococcus chromogenes]|uniref:O-antigen ligase family protein n=1 Tax=Staphylococcus chromogenes TaxID=46126 RepID=UPI00118C6712|nr:oligosaccharide repeat unit polymerase [Staphylococcus chromogenes]QDX00087.1 O-antigen ligase family protein [Staphylococcus chromogenes]